MFDTTPEIQQKQIEILLAKTLQERFFIGDQTIAFGRLMLESSIKQQNQGISDIDLRIKIFKRCYEKQFSTGEMGKIIASMKSYLKSVNKY